MTNVTIDGLPAAQQANNADFLEVSQNGASRKVTRQQLLAGTALAGIVTSSGLMMTTARILGRTTGGEGAIEELTSVPVSLGGTGATTAAAARTNLGLDTASSVTFNAVNDSKGNVRDLPINNQTAGYTASLSDAGGIIRITTGGVTIPNNVFSPNQVFTIMNNSASSQTITQAAGVTLRLAATSSTGNRTLAGYGLCTVTCVANNEFLISGPGLS